MNNHLDSTIFFLNNEIDFCRFIHSKINFKNYPQHIYIENTNACNLKCIMCSRNQMSRKIRTMTLNNFVKIINNLIELKIYPRLTITGSGEPLLDRSLIDKIRYAKENHFHVSIISNATLLSEEKTIALIKSGLDRIQFSFDSINKKTYDKIRIPTSENRKSYYESTLRNIELFLLLNNNLTKKVYVSISSVQMDLNRKEAEKFKMFWHERGVDNVYLPEVMVRSGKGGENRVNDKNDNQRNEIKAKCVLPFIIASIMSDGNISICGPTKDELTVGNVLESSIENVWFGKEFTNIRDSILRKDKKYLSSRGIMCHECDVWEYGNSFENYFEFNKLRNEKVIKYILS